MRLAFEASGDGPPLIVLHGLFASAANWRCVAGSLAGDYRVYCVDLRNHGGSPRASSMSYDEMADDVLSLIEHEGLERPHVLGHGIGGKVAMALALTCPYAVGGLTIVDVAPVTYLDQGPQWMREHFAHADGGGAGLSDTLRTQLMARYFAMRGECVDWRVDLGAIGLSIPALCAFPRRLRYLSSDVPLRAVVGGRSDCVRAPHADAFAPMFTHVTVDVIEGAGHWVHAERPDALVRALLSRPPRRAAAPAAETFP